MNCHLSTTVRRLVGAVAASLVALTVIVGPGAAASADRLELPVNALAPEITTEANLAIEAFDTYIETDELSDYLIYAKHRIATARLAARQLGYDEFSMIDAWTDADLPHQRAVLAAMSQVGVPYRSHTSIEGEGFDCSGLTLYAWGEAEVELNRISGDQIRSAEKRSRDEASAGDLVHYPGHVMMYLGVEDAIIHSVRTGRTVEIDTISARRASSVRFGDPLG